MPNSVHVMKDVRPFLSSRIISLEVVASPVTGSGASRYNHWRLFAVLSRKSLGDGDSLGRSIVLDMSVASDGNSGVLMVQYKPYDISYNSVTSKGLELKASVTVDDLIKSITDNKKDRYRFTPNGDGCRYWIKHIIAFWEHTNLLKSGSAKSVDSIIRYLWISSTEKHESKIGEGTFLD